MLRTKCSALLYETICQIGRKWLLVLFWNKKLNLYALKLILFLPLPLPLPISPILFQLRFSDTSVEQRAILLK